MSIIKANSSSGGVVDDFWIVVLLHFAEVLQDIWHLLLSLLTTLAPWRAMQLLCAVSETDKTGTSREAQEIYNSYCDAKECLADYRAGMAPLMNSLSKQHDKFGESMSLYHGWYYHYCAPCVSERLKELEQYTWKEYKKTISRILKQAEKGVASLQALGKSIANSKQNEELLLQQWAHRTVFNTLSSFAEFEWRAIAKRNDFDLDSISALLVQVVEAAELQTKRNRKENEQHIEEALVRHVHVYIVYIIAAFALYYRH